MGGERERALVIQGQGLREGGRVGCWGRVGVLMFFSEMIKISAAFVSSLVETVSRDARG